MKGGKVPYLAAGAGFLTAFGFFQFGYPYHLMRREQLNLFVFDWDYIGRTYKGVGWLARLACDFLEQFFHLPVAGPLVIALLLTGIGVAVFMICRHFLGRWPSLVIAALFYAWSFLRETENLFSTRYTLVVLGYLGLILLAFRFKGGWRKCVAAVLLLACGIWPLGAPAHHYYGALWGTPSIRYDKIIGVDTEVSRERWDKVVRLSNEDLMSTEACYSFNLAHAMKGDLGSVLLNHSQNGTLGLLIWIAPGRSLFTNCMAGEAWYQMGNMTMAEQSAIIALQASPKHTGTRFLLRLARTNLISGEYGAAQKYLTTLGRTLFYGKWARRMLAHIQEGTVPDWVEKARRNLAGKDLVYDADVYRPILLDLLEANPGNRLAQEYLLCYDLLRYDLEHFMEDLPGTPVEARIYQEAIMVWLSQHNSLTPERAARYGIDVSAFNRMNNFFSNPERYRNTYWYYYTQASKRSNP
jgi:hypothetical protein